MLRTFLILLLSLAQLSTAHAAFVLPETTTPEQKTELRTRLTEEAPWVAVYGATYLDMYVNGLMALGPWLEGHQSWQDLAKARGVPRTLLVESVEKVNVAGLTLKPDLLERQKKVVAEILGSYPNAENLAAAIREVAEWVSTRESRALITGLINSLPASERAQYFKMPQLAEQVRALEESLTLTDALLKENFRGLAFGIPQEEITRELLMGMLNESLNREATLMMMLHSAWNRLSGGTSYDALNLKPDELKNLIAFTGLTGKTAAFLDRLIKSRRSEDDYEQGNVTENKFAKNMTIKEVSPELAMTRGCLMRDCNTHAWGFTLSPQEYAYLVSGPNDEPLGFIVATLVAGPAKERILFVHDIGGALMIESVIEVALNAMLSKLPEMGFDLLTFNAANGNSSGWASWYQNNQARFTRNIRQTYPDADFRQHIGQKSGYTYAYDSHTNPANLNPKIFDGSQDLHHQVTVIEGEVPGAEIKLSAPDVILKAIELFSANPEAGITPAMLDLGVTRQEMSKLVRALANPQELPLNEYYQSIAEYLEQYEIRLSRNFAREHDHLFQDGHLAASDALTTEDPAYRNQSVRFAIVQLKRLDNPKAVYELIEKNLQFFLGSEPFQAYLKSFRIDDPRQLPKIQKFFAMGVDLSFLIEDRKGALLAATTADTAMRLWALEALPREVLSEIPVEIVRLVAADLGSDHDEWPRRASLLIMQMGNTNDPAVMTELEKSGKEEELIDIAMRASVLFLENGGDSKTIRKRVRKYAESPDIDAETRARIQALLPNLPDDSKKENQEECEEAVTPT